MSVKNGIAKKIFHAAIIVVISVAMSLLFSACAPKDDGEEHTHEYVNYTYNNDATCVADGTETGKCKYCDKTNTRTKANTATGVHTFTDYTYNNDATCVTDGTETATCANCSATDTRTSAAHPATGVHTYDATDCCTVCGRQKPTGSEQCVHSYSNYVYNNDATCVTDGTETAKCKYCDKTDTRVSAAHSATGVHTFANDVCTGCGEYSPNIVVTQGLKFTEITENNEVVGYELSGIGSVTDTEIVIPKTYNGKPVTSLRMGVFYDCSNLMNITIPNSVMNIGDFAFHHCSNLTNISIPSSVIRIGHGAFVGCNCLTSIMISSGVTSIGSFAFVDCSSLTSITIPNSVTSIGGEVFVNCGLTSITIPDSVTSIGSAVFYGCSSLTSVTVATGNTKYHSAGNCIIETLTKTLIAGHEKSVIPMDGSVTSIGEGAFVLSSFTSITIPNSVTSIGEGAFSGCRGLTSISVSSGNERYYSVCNCIIEKATKTFVLGCKNSIIPNDGSVTSIGSYAFSGSSGLTSITIPNGVTSIGGAFSHCSGLTSITISSSVTSIDFGALFFCSELKEIKYMGTKREWKKVKKDRDWYINWNMGVVICSNGKVKIK